MPTCARLPILISTAEVLLDQQKAWERHSHSGQLLRPSAGPAEYVHVTGIPEGVHADGTGNSAIKRMKLRYAGTCSTCGVSVPSGVLADYHRATKSVSCLSCSACATDPEVTPGLGGSTPAPDPPALEHAATASITVEPRVVETPVTATPPLAGTGGASARREYERRRDKRETRIRTKHPRLGGLILAIIDEPQSTKAWAVGAKGEELLARRLDKLSGSGVAVLHDRRIPGSRANIDHIAVSAAGVFVIDAKRYTGRPHLRVEGGLFRPRVETLMVGRRDCSKLVAGVHKQVDLVRAALGQADIPPAVPTHGILCFVDGDWPLIGGSFTVEGLEVLWPGKAQDVITRPGPLTDEQVRALHRVLAKAFPIA